MDLRLYRAFVSLAEASSFSSAASALSITQPALTKQIQQLEREIGTPLFTRGRHGSRLTEAGSQLLSDARDLVERAERFESRVRSMAAGDVGRLTVGFGLSSITIAPRAVATFRKRYPHVSVSLEDMSSAAQLRQVQSGALDIAFVRLPVDPPLPSIPVHEDTLAVAHPSDWGAPNDTRALSAWLEQHPLVQLTPERGPGLCRQIHDFVTDAGARPTVVQGAGDIQTVLALVAARIGAALVPASARAIAPPSVELVPIDRPSAQWRVGVVWEPSRSTAPVRNFLTTLTRLTTSTASARFDKPDGRSNVIRRDT